MTHKFWSKCCGADVTQEGGGMTHWWRCEKCEKACDTTYATPTPPEGKERILKELLEELIEACEWHQADPYDRERPDTRIWKKELKKLYPEKK